MKHILIVLSIILIVSLPFLYPSVENVIDGSFNDYEYLQKLRRTRSDINTDNKDKGWQENGTFNSWYQKGNGSENDKALNNLTSKVTSAPDSKITPSQGQSKTSTPTTETKSETKSESKIEPKSTNILPYLLILLLMIIVIIYIKYKY